jgi:hypothetical protein
MKVLSANVQRVPQDTNGRSVICRSFSGDGVSYLPAANAEQKAHDIALLLLLQLLEVLVGAHLCENSCKPMLRVFGRLRRGDSGRRNRLSR